RDRTPSGAPADRGGGARGAVRGAALDRVTVERRTAQLFHRPFSERFHQSLIMDVMLTTVGLLTGFSSRRSTQSARGALLALAELADDGLERVDDLVAID